MDILIRKAAPSDDPAFQERSRPNPLSIQLCSSCKLSATPIVIMLKSKINTGYSASSPADEMKHPPPPPPPAGGGGGAATTPGPEGSTM
jgi:hypothetical protein